MRLLSKRRRIENRTNYTKRKKLLESEVPRIVLRKSNKYITLQLVESESAQDRVLESAFSKELLDYGWPEARIGSLKSLPAAYLSGFLFGKKLEAKKIKLKKSVIDTGLIRNTKGSKIYSALLGLKDSGANINLGQEVIPEQKRIVNDKVANFFEKVKENIDKLKNAGGKK
jgi:large subunit ribosomal protein L18